MVSLSMFKVQPDENGNLPPKETVNWAVIALALFGAGAAILFGYDLGFIGGVIILPAFVDDYNLKGKSASYVTEFDSNVVSVFQAGAIGGAIVSSILADSVGRRKVLLANFITCLIGCTFMVAASGSAGVALLYTGRVLTGWSSGATTGIVPVYVAECSPPHIRGRLAGLYEVGTQFGTMIGFWIPYALKETRVGTVQWRVPFALQLIPSGLCFIFLFFLSETPRFMVRKHGETKALVTLAYLRGLPDNHQYVQQELAAIGEQVEHDRSVNGELGHWGKFRRTFRRSNIRRLGTGCAIFVFMQMCGTTAVNYYSPRIFESFVS